MTSSAQYILALEKEIISLREQIKQIETLGTAVGVGAVVGSLFLSGIGSLLGIVAGSAIAATALGRKLTTKRDLQSKLKELERQLELVRAGHESE